MKTLSLGTLGGLKLNAEPSAQIFTGIVALILALLGNIVFGLSIIEAVLGAIVATALFWLSEFWHQYGHALAARMVGYPMLGVTFFLVLGRSLYPSDEPTLPPNIHIRRALGGPIASLILSVVMFILMRLTSGMSGAIPIIIQFLFYLNFFIYTLQVFVPLGFNDGSTILRNLRK